MSAPWLPFRALEQDMDRMDRALMVPPDDWAVEPVEPRQQAAVRLIGLLSSLVQQGSLPPNRMGECRHLANLVLGRQQW